jgi:hypothetical protein
LALLDLIFYRTEISGRSGAPNWNFRSLGSKGAITTAVIPTITKAMLVAAFSWVKLPTEPTTTDAKPIRPTKQLASLPIGLDSSLCRPDTLQS